MEEQVPGPRASEGSESKQKDLPIIQIVSEREETFVHFGLNMEDSTYDMLVKWGKEVATDDDYAQIAMTHAIKSSIESSVSESV